MLCAYSHIDDDVGPKLRRAAMAAILGNLEHTYVTSEITINGGRFTRLRRDHLIGKKNVATIRGKRFVPCAYSQLMMM